jgi:hypothetical protein
MFVLLQSDVLAKKKLYGSSFSSCAPIPTLAQQQDQKERGRKLNSHSHFIVTVFC